MNRSRLLVAGLAASFAMGAVGTALATVPMMQQAKKAGVAATNCLYCHGEKIPKKGTSTYNERGQWLMAEKEKRTAEKVDGAWLKDYVEPAEPPPAVEEEAATEVPAEEGAGEAAAE